MKKLWPMLGLGFLALAVLIATNKPGDYHLREFESIKANFNAISPPSLNG